MATCCSSNNAQGGRQKVQEAVPKGPVRKLQYLLGPEKLKPFHSSSKNSPAVPHCSPLDFSAALVKTKILVNRTVKRGQILDLGNGEKKGNNQALCESSQAPEGPGLGRPKHLPLNQGLIVMQNRMFWGPSLLLKKANNYGLPTFSTVG